MKVTIDSIHYAYEIAKQCYSGLLSFTEAYERIATNTGMAPNSAKDYINNLKYMLEGKCYARTLNTYATRFYIKRIREDYGEKAYRCAIEATRLHVAYYNGLGYGKRRSIEKILKEMI